MYLQGKLKQHHCDASHLIFCRLGKDDSLASKLVLVVALNHKFITGIGNHDAVFHFAHGIP